MRIACPACNAAYQVPDAQLHEGRVVRCARCGSDWAPVEAIPVQAAEPAIPQPVSVPAEAPIPAPESIPEPIPEPIQDPVPERRRMAIEEEIPIPRPPVLPKAPPKRRPPVLLVLAWVVSLGLVGAGVAGLYVGRDRVIAIWPPSLRAYAALGLAAKPSPAPAHEASEGHE